MIYTESLLLVVSVISRKRQLGLSCAPHPVLDVTCIIEIICGALEVPLKFPFLFFSASPTYATSTSPLAVTFLLKGCAGRQYDFIL